MRGFVVTGTSYADFNGFQIFICFGIWQYLTNHLVLFPDVPKTKPTIWFSASIEDNKQHQTNEKNNRANNNINIRNKKKKHQANIPQHHFLYTKEPLGLAEKKKTLMTQISVTKTEGHHR